MYVLKIAAALGIVLASVAGVAATECASVQTVVVTVTVLPDWCISISPPSTPTTLKPAITSYAISSSPPAVVPSSGQPPVSAAPSITTGIASTPPGEMPSYSVPVTTPGLSTSIPSVTTASHSMTPIVSVLLPSSSSPLSVPTVSTAAAPPSMTSGPVMAGLLLAGVALNGLFAVLV